MGEDTVVLHLAARTGVASPAEYTKTNVEGTVDLLEAAAATLEDTSGYPYAASKQEAERAVRGSGLRWTILRPTIVLGRDAPAWKRFATLARAPLLVIPGDGRARIQPVHVEDLVGVLLRIVDEDRFEGEAFDVGGADVVSMEDFLRRAHRRYQVRLPGALKIPLRPGLALLRAAEKLAPGVLPVSAGQFTSFMSDGVAESSEFMEEAHPDMRGIDAILDELTET
jgi:NADH dehydrogenase